MATRKPAVTYTFDLAAVVTARITTRAGESAAQRAADSLVALSVTATSDELDVSDAPADAVFDVTTVAPRGRGYLVDAITSDGTEIGVSESQLIQEPITGERDALKAELDNALDALQGDSNDAEHEALYGIAQTLARVLGIKDEDLPEGF